MYRFDIGAIYQYSIPIQISSPLVFPDTLLPTLAAVRAEIAEVRSALTRQQSLLEQILTELNGGVEEIEVQEVDDSEAKRRILELFTDSSGSLFYDDIAERLRLPLRQTVEICNQLELEGLIAEPATKQ
jgi:predicted Rossmann fold nucleotide-binding protein DprA/Smf involved in DNA uptake